MQGRSYEYFDIPVASFDRGLFKFGVDAQVMAKWWETQMDLDPSDSNRIYRQFSKEFNCVSMVMRGLSIGGFLTFATPRNPFFYNDVDNLRNWINQGKAEIDARNQNVQLVDVFNDILVKAREVAADRTITLPTLREWIDMSNENVWNPFARRLLAIACIDDLVERYHREPADNELSKDAFLINIFNQAMLHIYQKPDSHRKDSVRKMASIALGLFIGQKYNYEAYQALNFTSERIINVMKSLINQRFNPQLYRR